MPTVCELITSAIDPTATAMRALAETASKDLIEKDLETTYKASLKVLSRATGPRSDIVINQSVSWAEWPRVGDVDVALMSHETDQFVAFIELKWGSGTLHNCVWDLCKMGVALRKGTCTEAYLVAGAPQPTGHLRSGRSYSQPRSGSLATF
jgi:hypothetical protein